MRRALPALVLAGLLTAGAAASTSARTARVDVHDTRVAPVAAAVDVGGTVTWRNRGTKSHRLASGAFVAFTIAPGRTHAVTFRSAGCKRYSVDGRIAGRVVVGGVACTRTAGSPSPGGGTPPGSGGTDTTPLAPGETRYRYLVRMTGQAEHVEETTDSPDPGAIGVQTWKASFSGTWREVVVRVIKAPNGDVVAGIFEGGTKGTVAVSLSYRDTRPKTACSGTSGATRKGDVLLSLDSRRNGRSHVLGHGRASGRGRPVCAQFGVVWSTFEARSGRLTLRIDDEGFVEFVGDGRGTFFPVVQIRDGRSFRVGVSTRVIRGGSLGRRYVVRWSGSLSFTRR